jgi:hypothetical protein
MFSKSPKETLSPYSRVERIILRLSRNKVLLPYDVSDICHRIAPKLRKRHKSILPEWWDCGALGEAPLFVTSLYPRDVFEFCDIADKLPKDSFEFNLAVLLFVMGDKHAVRHATSRSSAKFWRGKAVNS